MCESFVDYECSFRSSKMFVLLEHLNAIQKLVYPQPNILFHFFFLRKTTQVHL